MNSTMDRRFQLRAKQGIPSLFVDVRAVNDSSEVPGDGTTQGELRVRGSSVAASYYRRPEERSEWTGDRWLRTWDVATIDPDGYVKITDRTKDLIKSGGEWISAVDVENAIVAHPSVIEAAVVAVPYPKWQAGPQCLVILKSGAEACADELRTLLATTFAKWQLPDDFILFLSCLTRRPESF